MIHLKITNHPIDQIESELALVTTFEDIRPLKGTAGLIDWRLNGKLSRIILHSKFSGLKGGALLMPASGRLDSKEILILGAGSRREMNEQEISPFLHFMVEKLFLKKTKSFSLSLSDLMPGMFEWRNSVRLFVSMISDYPEDLVVTLIEDRAYVEDAKKRHMDFAYDIDVHYELI